MLRIQSPCVSVFFCHCHSTTSNYGLKNWMKQFIPSNASACPDGRIRCNTLVNIVTNLLRMPSADVKINWFHKFSFILPPIAPWLHRTWWNTPETLSYSPATTLLTQNHNDYQQTQTLPPLCNPSSSTAGDTAGSFLPPPPSLLATPAIFPVKLSAMHIQIESDLLTCDIYHLGLRKLFCNNCRLPVPVGKRRPVDFDTIVACGFSV